ncbi:hypothetical protein [Aquimarina sp. 2201CG5-10]|uniref:hypothetical protein n=1 Tax=Aquimarina callyspongiae TaxID=3098150 RepID=UPI002AB40EA7|nr:hypothetical protein [Aquimarina sp. 2201CG5-10]MDY8135672.1 hypothetical protein [Aquimarina sp. 2201CG5-10]
MKTILNLNGIKTIGKEEQSKISGASRYGCEQRGWQCCEPGPHGDNCGVGECTGHGSFSACLWY